MDEEVEEELELDETAVSRKLCPYCHVTDCVHKQQGLTGADPSVILTVDGGPSDDMSAMTNPTCAPFAETTEENRQKENGRKVSSHKGFVAGEENENDDSGEGLPPPVKLPPVSAAVAQTPTPPSPVAIRRNPRRRNRK